MGCCAAGTPGSTDSALSVGGGVFLVSGWRLVSGVWGSVWCVCRRAGVCGGFQQRVHVLTWPDGPTGGRRRRNGQRALWAVGAEPDRVRRPSLTLSATFCCSLVLMDRLRLAAAVAARFVALWLKFYRQLRTGPSTPHPPPDRPSQESPGGPKRAAALRVTASVAVRAVAVALLCRRVCCRRCCGGSPAPGFCAVYPTADIFWVCYPEDLLPSLCGTPQSSCQWMAEPAHALGAHTAAVACSRAAAAVAAAVAAVGSSEWRWNLTGHRTRGTSPVGRPAATSARLARQWRRHSHPVPNAVAATVRW